MTIPLSASRLHLACAAIAALVLHSCIPEPAFAATPLQLRWTAELSDPKPYNAVLFQGESADLVATLKLYGRAVAIEETATASLYYQTNGMGSAWWQSPATVTTAGVVTASWTPGVNLWTLSKMRCAGADAIRAETAAALAEWEAANGPHEDKNLWNALATARGVKWFDGRCDGAQDGLAGQLEGFGK